VEFKCGEMQTTLSLRLSNAYAQSPANQQSAYQSLKSTETALESTHNDLVHSINNVKVSLLVLLDPSVAFDSRHC